MAAVNAPVIISLVSDRSLATRSALLRLNSVINQARSFVTRDRQAEISFTGCHDTCARRCFMTCPLGDEDDGGKNEGVVGRNRLFLSVVRSWTSKINCVCVRGSIERPLDSTYYNSLRKTSVKNYQITELNS